MNCEACSKEAMSGDKFCRNCGSQIPEEEVYGCECGSEVRKEDKFCHGCGAPFSATGICECGNSLAENAKFCHACGKEVLGQDIEEPKEVPEEVAENQKVNYRQNTDGTFTFVKSK